MHWASRLIAAISACRPQSCMTWVSGEFVFFRIIQHKTRALVDAGIEVVDQVPCEVAPTPHSLDLLADQEGKNGAHAESRISMKARSDDEDFEFASIEEAIRELQAGRMIVVVDDEDRENEGDLTMAAEMITPEAINFMAMHGRGLICLAMTGERLDELELAPMTAGQHRVRAARRSRFRLTRKDPT